jgi:hypothetical protein
MDASAAINNTAPAAKKYGFNRLPARIRIRDNKIRNGGITYTKRVKFEVRSSKLETNFNSKG